MASVPTKQHVTRRVWRWVYVKSPATAFLSSAPFWHPSRHNIEGE